jgi:ribose 5-phosphate isomerase A
MEWKDTIIRDLQWSDAIINREGKERVAAGIASKMKDGPVFTENGNFVLDTRFDFIHRAME